jgi:glucan biosynthesis protein
MVDFTGDNLTRLSPEANLVAVPTTDNPDVEALSGTVTRNLLDNSWRASFRLKVKDGAPRPAQVEVRCFLKHGENCLTETWSSLMPL